MSNTATIATAASLRLRPSGLPRRDDCVAELRLLRKRPAGETMSANAAPLRKDQAPNVIDWAGEFDRRTRSNTNVRRTGMSRICLLPQWSLLTPQLAARRQNAVHPQRGVITSLAIYRMNHADVGIVARLVQQEHASTVYSVSNTSVLAVTLLPKAGGAPWSQDRRLSSGVSLVRRQAGCSSHAPEPFPPLVSSFEAPGATPRREQPLTTRRLLCDALARASMSSGSKSRLIVAAAIRSNLPPFIRWRKARVEP